jgi:hypothetical protein
VSSLWTPDGEHKVPRPDDAGAPSGGGPRPSASPSAGTPPARTAPPGGLGDAGDDQPSEEELRQIARELAETPVEDIIVNHCYGLFELAALHLSQQPVNLAAARLAIDAMGQLVEGLGERLGPHAGTLADGLTQLRLAFVRIADAAAAAATAGSGTDAGKGSAAPDAGKGSAGADAAADGSDEPASSSRAAASASGHGPVEDPEGGS